MSTIPQPGAHTESRSVQGAFADVHWSTLALGAAITALVVWSYYDALGHLVGRWSNEADYSHGFLVPVFAAYLLWQRRHMDRPQSSGGLWAGAALLLAAAGIRIAADYLSYTLLDPLSLLPCLAGLALIVGGWGAFHRSWPAIAFLAFMVPLPGSVAGQLSGPLQRVSTLCSTYLLQTVGVPATASGNVIWLTDGRIGVVEACNGLRMLLTFFAITAGAAIVLRRPLWEKVVVLASAPLIGILANVLRITSTGIVLETAGRDWADRVFHDFAGWVMMPLAMGLLWAELWVLSRMWVAAPEEPVLVRRGVLLER